MVLQNFVLGVCKNILNFKLETIGGKMYAQNSTRSFLTAGIVNRIGAYVQIKDDINFMLNIMEETFA